MLKSVESRRRFYFLQHENLLSQLSGAHLMQHLSGVTSCTRIMAAFRYMVFEADEPILAQIKPAQISKIGNELILPL